MGWVGGTRYLFKVYTFSSFYFSLQMLCCIVMQIVNSFYKVTYFYWDQYLVNIYKNVFGRSISIGDLDSIKTGFVASFNILLWKYHLNGPGQDISVHFVLGPKSMYFIYMVWQNWGPKRAGPLCSDWVLNKILPYEFDDCVHLGIHT